MRWLREFWHISDVLQSQLWEFSQTVHLPHHTLLIVLYPPLLQFCPTVVTHVTFPFFFWLLLIFSSVHRYLGPHSHWQTTRGVVSFSFYDATPFCSQTCGMMLQATDVSLLFFFFLCWCSLLSHVHDPLLPASSSCVAFAMHRTCCVSCLPHIMLPCHVAFASSCLLCCIVFTTYHTVVSPSPCCVTLLHHPHPAMLCCLCPAVSCHLHPAMSPLPYCITCCIVCPHPCHIALVWHLVTPPFAPFARCLVQTWVEMEGIGWG